MDGDSRVNNEHDRRPEDIHASILFDIARAVQIAPRMLPEDFGPKNRYRLEELIGLGRDSHVYQAVDRHLSKPQTPARVAIKIRMSGTSTRTEALVGRSVIHDNVVRVIDHGVTDDGEYYIVQEWISGGDLADLGYPLAAKDAVQLLILIARGIQALHSAGNIHGDLKPSNILRTTDGTPKIIDFDLASATDLEEYRRGGNLAFMPPEILLEEKVLPSPLGDIYSLGGLLYYFLLGKLPHGDDPQEIVDRHRRSAAIDMQGLDPDLAHICTKALAANPNNRYRSAEALAADLELWLDKYPIPWTNPSPKRRAVLFCRRRPVPIAIGILVALASITTATMVQVILARNVEAQRRAITLSQAELDELNAKARASIKEYIEGGIMGNRSRRGPSLFAALAWVDWIARSSLLGEEGPIMSRNERVAGLISLREHMREEGQTGSLADGLAAYSLAYSYIEEGNYRFALDQLADTDSGVLGSLPASDDTARSVRALRLLAQYKIAAQANDIDATKLRDQLESFLIEFRNFDNTHSVAQLIQLVLDREDG